MLAPPVPPDVIVTQLGAPLTVHEQLAPAVRVTVALPPAEEKDWLVGDNVALPQGLDA